MLTSQWLSSPASVGHDHHGQNIEPSGGHPQSPWHLRCVLQFTDSFQMQRVLCTSQQPSDVRCYSYFFLQRDAEGHSGYDFCEATQLVKPGLGTQGGENKVRRTSLSLNITIGME